MIMNPNHTMYVGTDIGVFKSSNKGESWIRFSENLPVCAVYDMKTSYSSKKTTYCNTWKRNMGKKS